MSKDSPCCGWWLYLHGRVPSRCHAGLLGDSTRPLAIWLRSDKCARKTLSCTNARAISLRGSWLVHGEGPCCQHGSQHCSCSSLNVDERLCAQHLTVDCVAQGTCTAHLPQYHVVAPSKNGLLSPPLVRMAVFTASSFPCGFPGRSGSGV